MREQKPACSVDESRLWTGSGKSGKFFRLARAWPHVGPPPHTSLTAMAAESQPTRKVAFITGVTGQDGSYLSEFLLEKGYEVHGASLFSVSFSALASSRAHHRRTHACTLSFSFARVWVPRVFDFCCVLA